MFGGNGCLPGFIISNPKYPKGPRGRKGLGGSSGFDPPPFKSDG
jgi:hypothetical protein